MNTPRTYIEVLLTRLVRPFVCTVFIHFCTWKNKYEKNVRSSVPSYLVYVILRFRFVVVGGLVCFVDLTSYVGGNFNVPGRATQVRQVVS